MFTLIGHSQPAIAGPRVLRIARGPKRIALAMAWLGVLAGYAITGSVAPAYAAKLPTVTTVTPSSGPATGGTVVAIEGTFFKNVSAVKFGSTNATSFTVKSSTAITAISPAGAVGTVDVTVTIPGGRSSAPSAADHFEFTPTITAVSPNTGPPTGGTPITVAGSGFAVGESATRITFGPGETAVEAAGVNCTTTTECTATTPEFSREWSNPVDVTATVNNVASPQTPADQFTYHGLYLVGEDGSPFRVGETVVLRGIVKATETEDCFAFVEGTIASNGQTTDEIDIRPAEFEACEQEHFFADLPFSFVLRLSDEGSATIVGPMGVRTGFSNGCVYESDHISGTFETEGPLDFRLNATFPLVAEEEPGCNATEQVALDVFTDKGYAVELIG